MFKSRLKTIVLAVSVIFLAFALISHPKEALKASLKGLHTWWEVVFPSLLPFFIIAELLIGFGVVKFLGVLLEPLMRPIFRVPGVGGFVWAMGMASGNPAGAKFSVRLRKDELISQIEAERLVAFTSCANPLFIFGAIAVGFFQNARLGMILAISHHVANIFVGLIMRYHGKDKLDKKVENQTFSIKNAFKAMHETRIQDKRPFGTLLGDAVTSSIHTLLMIGGFIILFSVVNTLLSLMNVTDFLAVFINHLFSILSLPESFSIPFISGLFEMTIGSQLISEVENVELLKQVIVVSFMLAFAGFSIQAQVGSLLSQTDIRFLPFFFARIIQGVFASIITLIIWKPLYEHKLIGNIEIIPVFMSKSENSYSDLFTTLTHFGPLITLLSLFVYIIVYGKRMIYNR
ncbi:sporulation integral membrane protein YlbJ [Bacillus andreraoultii]|uniref:sporulation integral membrane protein YlbJ n=1 Tax=Bacillus andreraoultii TaxID=1499685 RepID=UPI00053AF21F|nr:sporulation integral membrane protein YlbJ [Bacillus andreraoultii]